jgi:hypothetical protein
MDLSVMCQNGIFYSDCRIPVVPAHTPKSRTAWTDDTAIHNGRYIIISIHLYIYNIYLYIYNILYRSGSLFCFRVKGNVGESCGAPN